MKTIITSVVTVALLICNLAKPCLAQQTKPNALTSVGATSVTSTSAGATSVGATYKLTVVISDLSKRSGKLYFGLANSEASFDGESLQKKTVDVPASGEISITFDGLTTGRYAVRLFQDLNDNGKMDFSGQMPAEPFGFSNVTILMGPPTFGQCSFDLTENKTIQVGIMSL